MGNEKKQITHYVLLITIIAVILFVGGCGYSVHRHAALPIMEIEIGRIENATLEPKLQDKLYRALTEEFMKQGISVRPASKLKLAGVIKKFDMVGLSEKNGIIVDYRVIVNIEFRLVDEQGKTTATKIISSPFIVSIAGSADLGTLLATKEVAEERAMADIAMELAGAMIYK